jgi:diaminohydroxyphosphoribosylaminopyrimidine deaminase/5-amino-6-(5-phosphoribosylamino)uracil reductase
VNTVLADDPLLTVRIGKPKRKPVVRVVVDTHLRIPLRARCLNAAAPTLIATGVTRSAKAAALRKRGIEVIVLPKRHERVDLSALCAVLVQRHCYAVLLEGGGTLIAGALQSGLVDRLYWFVAPRLLGGDALPAVGALGLRHCDQAIQLKPVTTAAVGRDWLVVADIVYPQQHSIAPIQKLD